MMWGLIEFQPLLEHATVRLIVPALPGEHSEIYYGVRLIF